MKFDEEVANNENEPKKQTKTYSKGRYCVRCVSNFRNAYAHINYDKEF